MVNKTLCAFAVCGMLAASASAQSNFTIYGVADAGIVRESGGVPGATTNLSSGVASGSRVGWRGTEELGGGMSALFILESGMLIDTGASAQGGLLFGRQALAGLKNSYGSLTVGRQYTPLFAAVSAIDPFLGIALAGTSANLLSQGGLRLNNAVKYTAPRVGGWSGELAYSLGEVAGDSSAGRQIGAFLNYQRGAFGMTLGHHNANNVPSATLAADNGKTTILGATYAVGAVKLALGYAVNKGLVTINGTVNRDTRDTLAGMTLPFGVSTLLVSYIHKQDKSGMGRDADQWAAGYLYALSKRTDLYASYARIHNHATPGRPGFYTVGNATAAGTGDQAYNAGMRHSF